jgi:hypothetical protein
LVITLDGLGFPSFFHGLNGNPMFWNGYPIRSLLPRGSGVDCDVELEAVIDCDGVTGLAMDCAAPTSKPLWDLDLSELPS